MNVLLLGSGGRECALAWKLSQSPEMGEFYIAPGNAGTSAFGTNIPVSPTDFAAIAEIVADKNIDLVIAGNEDPLVGGLRGYLSSHADPRVSSVLMLGPGADGAALEGSKDFAKGFMGRHGIPTARYHTVTADTIDSGFAFLESLQPPYVLKADGLAAGKGVIIEPDLAAAKEALRTMLNGQFGAASATVVIEEFLSGIECSVFVLTDGTGRYLLLPEAKDYKRVGEGDTGLNTGGMGSVSPVPFCTPEFMNKIRTRIVEPTVAGLKAESIDYRGFIFLGLINCDGDPYVIEYNVRMGDPETESVMPRIASDLLPVLAAAAKGDIDGHAIDTDARTAVAVMAVSGGYPGNYAKGKPIEGCLNPEDSLVFHAGTIMDGDIVKTSGGRVLAVVSYGENIPMASSRSYKSLDDIHFDGIYYRRDIGADLMK